MSAPIHTLLLVDDEPTILRLLQRSLRDEGYRILTAPSPSAALELLGAGGVDVIISDLELPEMTGVELLAQVRREHPAVLRMLLTGGATLDTALDAINDGEVYRYLTKPWDPPALRQTIREAFERLEELRRASAADRRTEQQTRLLAALEREHPGIGSVRLFEGVYRLEPERLDPLAAGLRSAALRAFLAPSG